ncbi:MAG: sugar nucleotide-binding protein [Bdellovibrionales bacterium]|nr:sugar nucleotide-binding protein [Bdellovibrionales bacterium]MBT7767917.1 sugar nucleotide-binding protein [Bdellovibrionales bacterium]
MKEKQPESESRQKTILIFGISSFVGSNLATFFAQEHKVFGTYRSTPVKIPGILTLPCDALNKDEVNMLFFMVKPDITIHCLGLFSIMKCAETPELADALNTNTVFNITESCQRYKSKLIYISTQHIFLGDNKTVYSELDIPDTNTIYGKTCAAAEFYIQKNSLDYLIFRCCRLYGRSINPLQVTLLEKIQQCSQSGKDAAFDKYNNMGFLDIIYLAMVIRITISKQTTNRLFHLSSIDICTAFEFAMKYSKIFNQPHNNITPGRWPYPVTDQYERGRESKWQFNLETTNLENYISTKLPTIDESLALTFDRFHGQPIRGITKGSSHGISFV